MEITIKENLEEEIKKILPKEDDIKSYTEFHEIMKRGLLYPTEIPKNRILFLGINPSFRIDHDDPYGYNEILFEKEISKIPITDRYVYFNVFQNICKEKEWTHYDILPFREVNQKKITRYYNEKDKFIHDILSQFTSLSKKIIELSEPQLIIVSNAFVRTLFSHGDVESNKNKFEIFKTKFSKEIGTHVISEGKLKNIPVFFTSMLSGQRAMDVGSRERLEWHIDFILYKDIKTN
jgi:hypothetical protein